MAIRIFPFAVNDESCELHFWANGVTLVTEDRHSNTTYYHGDATIQIEEPNPGAAVKVSRRGRTNEMRNRLFLVDVDEDGPFVKCTRDRDLDPNMTLEEMDAFICKLIDQPMESNETFRTYTIKKRNDGIVVVQQDTKPERVEPGTQQLKINMDEQRNESDAKEKAESDENSEDDLTKYGSDPQAPDRAPHHKSQGCRVEINWPGSEANLAIETIVQPEEEWDMLEASKINNKRTPKSIKDNEQEDKPHLLDPEPQAHRTVTTSPPSVSEYRCYTL